MEYPKTVLYRVSMRDRENYRCSRESLEKSIKYYYTLAESYKQATEKIRARGCTLPFRPAVDYIEIENATEYIINRVLNPYNRGVYAPDRYTILFEWCCDKSKIHNLV